MYCLEKRSVNTLIYTIMHWLANRMEERNGDMVAKLNRRTEDVCAYMFCKRGYILSLASAGIAEDNGTLFLRESGFQ